MNTPLQQAGRVFLIIVWSFTLIIFGGGTPIASAEDETILAADFFPMDEGSVWTYLENGTTEIVTTILTGTETINNKSTLTLQTTGGSTVNNASYSSDASGILKHRTIVYDQEVEGHGLQDVTSTTSPVFKLAKENITFGEEVVTSGTATYTVGDVESFNVSFKATTVFVGYEDVAVPAGEFKTIRMETTTTLSPTTSAPSFPESTTTQVRWLAKNIGLIKRTESVDDTTNTRELVESTLKGDPPIITLYGSPTVIIEQGETYVDDGVLVLDDIDGIISSRKVVVTGTVDTSQLGEYTITYTAEDSNGNISTNSRIIIVVEKVGVRNLTFPDQLISGNEYTFSVQEADNVDETFTWVFPDGTTKEGSSILYTFAAADDYTVEVTVTRGDESVSHLFIVTVEAPTYAFTGTVDGVVSGDSVKLVLFSEDVSYFKSMDYDSDGETISFTYDGLPAASDYVLQWSADGYSSGFWQQGSEDPVAWHEATRLDPTSGTLNDVALTLSKGSKINITLTGLPGDIERTLNLIAYSEEQQQFASTSVTTSDVTAFVLLEGLVPASDYRILIDDEGGGFRSGYITSSGGLAPGLGSAKLFDVLTTSRARVMVSIEYGYSVSGSITGLAVDQQAHLEVWSPRTQQGKHLFVTGTGSALTYEISGLPPSEDYSICIEAEALLGGCWAGNGVVLTNFNKSEQIDLSEDSKADVDFALSAGLSISGEITGLSAGDYVWIEAFSESLNIWKMEIVDASTGQYLIEGLYGGASYQIELHADGYKSSDPQTVTLVSSDVENIDFSVANGGSIEGSIIGLEQGQYASIEAFSPTAQQWITTSVTGTTVGGDLPYTISGLAASDDYLIAVFSDVGTLFYKAGDPVRGPNQADRVTVVDGQNTTGIDVNVSGQTTFSISGTISGLSDSDTVVTISAWNGDNAFVQKTVIGNASFTLENLASDSYAVMVSAPDHITQLIESYSSETGTVSWTDKWADAGTIEVSESITGLDVPMTTGYVISGSVSYDDDGAVAALEGARVTAWDPTQGIGGSAETLADGTYSIDGLLSGTYDIETIVSGKGRAVLSSVAVSIDVIGQDLVIAKKSGKISGTIIGDSAGFVLVVLYDANDSFVTAVISEQNGTYTFDGLDVETSYDIKVDTDGFFSIFEGMVTDVLVNGEVTQDITLTSAP